MYMYTHIIKKKPRVKSCKYFLLYYQRLSDTDSNKHPGNRRLSHMAIIHILCGLIDWDLHGSGKKNKHLSENIFVRGDASCSQGFQNLQTSLQWQWEGEYSNISHFMYSYQLQWIVLRMTSRPNCELGFLFAKTLFSCCSEIIIFCF